MAVGGVLNATHRGGREGTVYKNMNEYIVLGVEREAYNQEVNQGRSDIYDPGERPVERPSYI